MFQYFFPQKVSGLRLLALIATGLAATACSSIPSSGTLALSSAMPMGAETVAPGGYADFCRRHPGECRSSAGVTESTGERTRADDVEDPVIMVNTAELGAWMRTGGLSVDRRQKKVSLALSVGRVTDDPRSVPFSRDGLITSPDPVSSQTETGTDKGTGEAPGPLAMRISVLRRVNDAINSQVQPRTDLDNYGVPERWTMPLRYGDTVYGDCEDYALEKRRALIDAGVPETDLFLATAFSRRTGKHAVLIARTDSGDYVLDNASARIRPWRDTPYVWLSRQDPERPDRWVRVPPLG